MDEPSPSETTRTWGFRRSTIARREFIEEIGNLDLITLTPRRATRQSRGRGRGRARGRGKQPNEATSDAPKRTRGARRAVRAPLDPDPGPDDFITAPGQTCLPEDVETSDQAEDSDELTLKQLQERARKRRKSEEDGKERAGTAAWTPDTLNKGGDTSPVLLQSEESVSSLFDRLATRSAAVTKAGGVQLNREEERDEPNDPDESSVSDEEYSDPNAVYCICQQKHNNRQVPHSTSASCSNH